jgi:hypothetical protein
MSGYPTIQLAAGEYARCYVLGPMVNQINTMSSSDTKLSIKTLNRGTPYNKVVNMKQEYFGIAEGAIFSRECTGIGKPGTPVCESCQTLFKNSAVLGELRRKQRDIEKTEASVEEPPSTSSFSLCLEARR